MAKRLLCKSFALWVLPLLLLFPCCQLFQGGEEKLPAETEALSSGTESGWEEEDSAVTASEEEKFDELKEKRSLEIQKKEFVVQEFLESGKKLFKEGRLSEAQESLAQALQMDPQNKEAEDLFRRVSSMLGERIPEVGEAFEESRNRFLVKLQSARFEVEDRFQEGNEYMNRGEHDKAILSFEKALNILNWFQYDLDTSLDKAKLEAALKDARKNKKKADEETARKQAEEARKLKEEEERLARERLDEKIRKLFDEADRQFDKEDYEMAQKYAEAVLDLDYSNKDARRLWELARDARLRAREEHLRNEFAENWKRIMEQVRFSSIPQADIVEYDLKKWEVVSKRKPREFTRREPLESTEVGEIKEKLRSQVVTLDFDETPLKEVAEFLQTISNINFYVSKKVEETLVEGEDTITLKVEKITLERALKFICEYKNLAYLVEDGIVKVITPEELQEVKTVQLYYIQDLTHPLLSFPGPEINLATGEAGWGEEFGMEEEGGPKIFEPDRLENLIRENIAAASWEEDPRNRIDHRQGTLIVKQTPEVQDQIAALLDDLRKSTGVMVSIESRFLMVEDNFLEEVGVDFRGLGDDSGGVGLPGKGTDAFMDDVIPSDSGRDVDAGFFYDDGEDGDLRGRTENMFDMTLGGEGSLSNWGGFTAQWTILDDTEVEAIFRAVQKNERVNIITAPKLTIFNTQRANLTVLNEVSYIQDFDVEIAQAAFIADPVVNKVLDGVILDVRPIVSADRRFITLELRPTVATLIRPIPTFVTGLGTGAPVIIQTPTLEIQRVRTTVTMPDNSTLLLGGLKVSTERHLESSIPFVNKIPIISFFLSRKGKIIEKKNLLMLVKSRIVILDEIEPKRGFIK